MKKLKRSMVIFTMCISGMVVITSCSAGEKTATSAVFEESTLESKVSSIETPEQSNKSSEIYELYERLQDNEFVPYTINDKAAAFLKTHSNLFPAEKEADIDAALCDTELQYKHVAKNPNRYGDKLMVFPALYVAQITETEMEEDNYFTELNVSDSEGIQYYFLYNGELPEVFEDDWIYAYGLPLKNSSFKNTEGGETLVIVLAGSYVGILGEEETEISSVETYEVEDATVGGSGGGPRILIADSSERILEYGDIAWMTKEELRIAINEIYARHGRLFKDSELQEWFNAQTWYNGRVAPDDFNENVLSQVEKDNIKLMQAKRDGKNQKKALSGLYKVQLGSEGGAELEITYGSGDDVYTAAFEGSYSSYAGATSGFLVSRTDGLDGIWDYYETDSYEPSMSLQYDGADKITVTSIDGQTFGGMAFPGFSGTYDRIKEYPMP